MSEPLLFQHSSVTSSKSSIVAAAGEVSSGVKSTAPKFKERINPNRSKKRMKCDYEKARERQKFRLERKKKQKDDHEALKTKAGEGLSTDDFQSQQSCSGVNH
jgi:16S rRNA G1207 methylase RsmC